MRACAIPCQKLNPVKFSSCKIVDINAVLEKRKADIITSFYLTGRLDGLYFGRSSKAKGNPVKHYIKSCMYKNRIQDDDLINDCYNEMFFHLQNMSAIKFLSIYDESPNKLIATSLRIIALKCFAIDPRYNNPNHSLVQSILFASSDGVNVSIDHTEEFKDLTDCHGAAINNNSNAILKSQLDEPEDFTKFYGFTVEDVLARLTKGEQAAFYDVIGKQPRGKTPAAKKVSRDILFERLKQIKTELTRLS